MHSGIAIKDILKVQEFTGFQTLSKLKGDLTRIPSYGGVYAVLRETSEQVHFFEKSPAGRFKGKDPSYYLEVCHQKWVPNSEILYFGKATSLRDRLNQYISFGYGNAIGHQGGRLIWQVEGVWDFVVCWCPSDNPRQLEKLLLIEFKNAHSGRLPFANWKT